MTSKKLKFVAGGALIVGAVVWLAMAGLEEGRAYYQTIPELKAMGPRAENVRVRVAGDVVPGSIVRRGGVVEFDIEQDEDVLAIRYTGSEPLPDTLVDESQAVAEGYFHGDSFEAKKVQAKCASKYEAEYDASDKNTGYDSY